MTSSLDPEDIRAREWRRLYRSLGRVLAKFGKDDWLGRGDFSLLDDDYGIWDQKLTISRMEVLTRDLVAAIQATLADGYRSWSMTIAFDVRGMDAINGKMWLRVFHDRLEKAEGAHATWKALTSRLDPA